MLGGDRRRVASTSCSATSPTEFGSHATARASRLLCPRPSCSATSASSPPAMSPTTSASSAPGSTTITCRPWSTPSFSAASSLTAYTPYQPELSQGVLQAIFEYQTAICELTGMDVSNASGYDGTTVAADACFVAKHATGRARVVVTEATHPQVRQRREDVCARVRAGGRRGPPRRRHHRPGSGARCGGGRGSRDLPAPELLRLPRARRRPGGRRRRAAGRSRSHTSISSRSACSSLPAPTAARSRSARGSRPGTR